MKQLLAVLFCCCLSYSCISAEEASEFQVSVEGQDATQNIQDKSNAYYYRIREIDVADGVITLEDDSRWDIGLWYKDVILDWQVGDRLTITRDIIGWNEWGIHNLDRGSVAWGGILFHFFFPTPEKSDTVVEVVYDDSDPDFYGKITLKSGFQIGLRVLKFLPPFFEIGDPVFIFQSGESYLIMKLSGGWAQVGTVKVGTMLAVGNPDWRQESQ